MNLWNLEPLKHATIMGFSDGLRPDFKKRLEELGFGESREVLCIRKTPFAGTKVFQVGDSVFSLAKDLAELIFIQRFESTT